MMEKPGAPYDESSNTHTVAGTVYQTFYSEDWNFSIDYPSDWEVIWKDEPAGSWTIPIAVAAQKSPQGRASFIVNARGGELLLSRGDLTVINFGADGAPVQLPATLSEFIEMTRSSLDSQLPGFELLSEAETQLAGKPAVRLVYSYQGREGRITEESITLFGPGLTFQFICEAPSSRYSSYQDCFRQILVSFRLGRPVPDEKLDLEAPIDLSPLERYNLGVKLYRQGEFHRSGEAFEDCYRSGDYELQSAYAMALCQEELGLPVDLAAVLGIRANEAGPVYAATNLACTLLAKDYQAWMSKMGSTSEVLANVDGAQYRISIVAGFGFGGFFTNAWRLEHGQSITLADRTAHPNPTTADEMVLSLVKRVATLPPATLRVEAWEGMLSEKESRTPEAALLEGSNLMTTPETKLEVDDSSAIDEPPALETPALTIAASPNSQPGQPDPMREHERIQLVEEQGQDAIPKGEPCAVDFIDVSGAITQQGKTLTFQRGRFSSDTVSMTLDNLRFLYLFMPQKFQWQLIQSKIMFRFEDLETLSDQEYESLKAALAQAPKLLWGDFQFVLADYSGKVVKVSWKKMIDSGIDLLAQLRNDLVLRSERRQQWLRGNPAMIVRPPALFGSGTSMNTVGVLYGRDRFVPWVVVEKLNIHKHENITTTFTVIFQPTRASKLKAVAAMVSAQHSESLLAEIHFWQSLSSQAVAEEQTPNNLTGKPLQRDSSALPSPALPSTGLSTASLAFGLLTWTFLPGLAAPLAILTGHLALRKIRAHPDMAGGRNRAITGLTLGYFQVPVFCLLVVLLSFGKNQGNSDAGIEKVVYPQQPVNTVVVEGPVPAAIPVKTQLVEKVLPMATPTPLNTLADQEQATLTEQAIFGQATRIAMDNALKASATTQAQETQTAYLEAQAADLAGADPFIVQALQWPIVRMEDFATDTGYWPVGIEEGPYGTVERNLEGGRYVWKMRTRNGIRSIIDLADLTQQTDFHLSFEARLVKGPPGSSYGAEFRSDQGNNLYLFGVFYTEGFAFYKKQGEWSTLVDWQTSPHIYPYDTNRITIIAKGSHFIFMINNQIVARSDDGSLTSGTIGFSAEIANGGECLIEFDNLELRAPSPIETTGEWEHLADLPRQVNVFAIDPANPQLVYAGTGKDGSGSGVFRSTDGGFSWSSESNGLPSDDILAIAVNPQNSSQLFATSGMLALVYTSRDGGEHWMPHGDPRMPGGFQYQLLVSPDGKCVFILSRGFGLARNCGNDGNWQALKNGLPGDESSTFVLSLAADTDDANILYAGTGGFSGHGYGVFKSTDGGETWAPANRGMLDYRITALTVDPLNPQTVYAGGDRGDIFKSTNAGESWVDYTYMLPVEQSRRGSIREINLPPVYPGSVIMLYDQIGLLVSSDAGEVWTKMELPENLESNQLTALAVLPGYQPVVLMGIQGSGGWRKPGN